MKLLGVTQRVEVVQEYAERRDCLDQRWYKFANALGYIAVPLPNVSPDQLPSLLKAIPLDAILLSGGNSIASLEPAAKDAAPERDEFESALIGLAFSHSIPLVGVCRGMQMINVYLGGKLLPVTGHVAVRHELLTSISSLKLPANVNSYHNWCIPKTGLANDLEAIAYDDNANIEAYIHIDKKVIGVMWHPERELCFNSLDIDLIKRILL